MPAHGRPTRLTPEVADKLVELIAAGHYNSTAARGLRIGERTLTRWLTRGRQAAEQAADGEEVPESERDYLELHRRIEQATAEAEVRALAAITNAFTSDPRNWTAAAWFLERKDPARWGKRTEVNVGPTDRLADILAAATVTADELDDDEPTVPALPAPGESADPEPFNDDQAPPRRPGQAG